MVDLGLLKETFRGDKGMWLGLCIPVILSIAVFLFPASQVAQNPVGARELHAGNQAFSLHTVEFTPGTFSGSEPVPDMVFDVLALNGAALDIPLAMFDPDSTIGPGLLVSGEISPQVRERIARAGQEDSPLVVFAPSEENASSVLDGTVFEGAAYVGSGKGLMPTTTVNAQVINPVRDPIVIATPEWIRENSVQVVTENLANAIILSSPPAPEVLDQSLTNHGMITVTPYDSASLGHTMYRSTLAFAVSVCALVLLVLLTVGWSLAHAVRENLAALNIRSALGLAPHEIVVNLLVIVSTVWSVPALIAALPVYFLYPERSVIPLALAVALIPAVTVTGLLSIWLLRGGTKTQAQMTL